VKEDRDFKDLSVGAVQKELLKQEVRIH